MESEREFAEKVYQQLMNEKRKIENDLKYTHPGFHYGYNRVLIDKGYEDVHGCDSFSCFKCPGSVFEWRICQWNGWRVSDRVGIRFNGDARQEWHLRIDTKENFIADAVSLNLTEKDLRKVPALECKYTKYIVRDTGISPWCNSKIGEFDNLDDAVRYANKIAQEKCTEGRKSDLRRNYHGTPIDTTRYYKREYLLYLEYYYYSEHEYGISVEGVTNN